MARQDGRHPRIPCCRQTGTAEVPSPQEDTVRKGSPHLGYALDEPAGGPCGLGEPQTEIRMGAPWPPRSLPGPLGTCSSI